MSEWLDFFSSVIGSLAWPAALAVIVFLLRHEIRGLIASLRRLRYRDLDMEFGEQVRSLQDRAQEEELPPAMVREDAAHLAQTSPRALILEAWLELVYEATEAAKRAGFDLGPNPTPFRIFEALESNARITIGTRSLIEELRILRNAAAHSTDFPASPEEAMDYARLALRVAAVFRAVPRASDDRVDS